MLKSVFFMKKMMPVFACIALLSTSACAVAIATVAVVKNSNNEGIVTFQNYAHVQSTMQMNDYQKLAGGVNKWYISRKPVSIAKQPTIRMNRDTLYNVAVINVSKGATITLPDVGKRYISLMVSNEYGYTNLVYYGKGTYKLNPKNVGSDYAFVLVRTLVDANDAKDVKAVNNIQDNLKIVSQSNIAFKLPNWDMASYKENFDSLLELFSILPNAEKTFGSKEEVDPVRFLLGATGGFAGLPSKDAKYINISPDQSGKAYKIVMKDVPVDGFWSFSIYDKDGYFFDSEYGAPSINNIIATPDENGEYPIYFGNCEKEDVNCLAIKDGWNFVVRLYRPEEAILSGKWELPALEQIK